MRSEILIAGAMVATAVIGVRYLETRDVVVEHAQQAQTTEAAMTQAPSTSSIYPTSSGWGGVVKIAAARDNQFYADADVNRRGAHFLVDTGASYVAMRDSDARNAGIYTVWTDYTYPVRTANGETKAALVTIDEMEIGDIRIEDVKAFILPDDQLSVNLLGMSFLSRLESVEARSGELILKG